MGGGGKSKSSYKNPIEITSMMHWVGIGAVRAYSAVNSGKGSDLDVSKFLETVPLEVETSDLSNIGHPLYRPFMVRRYGHNVGLPEESNLAYDNVNTRWWAFNQIQEGMRVVATGKLQTLDDFHIHIGDTIPFEDITMGVRRLWLIEGIQESADGIEFLLVDVLGG